MPVWHSTTSDFPSSTSDTSANCMRSLIRYCLFFWQVSRVLSPTEMANLGCAGALLSFSPIFFAAEAEKKTYLRRPRSRLEIFSSICQVRLTFSSENGERGNRIAGHGGRNWTRNKGREEKEWKFLLIEVKWQTAFIVHYVRIISITCCNTALDFNFLVRLESLFQEGETEMRRKLGHIFF